MTSDGALADFGYVLEIDPGYLDAYINRVAILLERGSGRLPGAT